MQLTLLIVLACCQVKKQNMPSVFFLRFKLQCFILFYFILSTSLIPNVIFHMSKYFMNLNIVFTYKEEGKKRKLGRIKDNEYSRLLKLLPVNAHNIIKSALDV